MAHGHVHIIELDNKSKVPLFNLQFLNKNEILVLKNALDRVMPKDRTDAYTNISNTVNSMIVNFNKSTAPIEGAAEADPK